MLRRAATKGGEGRRLTPTRRTNGRLGRQKRTADDLIKMARACVASMLVVRYADVLIMHGNDGWALLPMTVLRQNIYIYPRKPVAVAPGLKESRHPRRSSPVFFTSNFAQHFYTSLSDIESRQTQRIPNRRRNRRISNRQRSCRTQSEQPNESRPIKASGIEKKVKHRKIIIPGKASRISENPRTQRLESPSWTTRQQ